MTLKPYHRLFFSALDNQESTFFNAATAFARQRNDAENLIGGATMAPHPFTTIGKNYDCFVLRIITDITNFLTIK